MSPGDFEALAELVFSWLRILDRTSYYELLGVPESASDREIQEAFHRFSESFHPDRHRAEGDEIRDGVTRIFRRGAEAYGILRDPKKRAAYDLALAQGVLRVQKARGNHPHPVEAGLDSECVTPGGKLHARQAERALTDGDPDLADRLIQKALLAEGNNPGLLARYKFLKGTRPH